MSTSKGELHFGPDRRVRKRREFQYVQSEGRRVTTPHYVLLVAAQKPEARAAGALEAGATKAPARPRRARLGLVVSRKVGGAVVRNRVKRVCRECFRLWPGLLPDGVDLVVIARNGAETLGLQEAQAEWKAVHRLLRRRAEEALAQARVLPHLSGGK
ncbi:MAG TPA: ribonuclease P protein component [Polyangiaceae bacterium]|jgi:ribonuclease P protein component